MSEDERESHGCPKPLDWTRRIADELGALLLGDGQAAIDTDEERATVRTRVWIALMPTQFRCIVKEVPVERAQAVHDVLKDERVQPNQMEIAVTRSASIR